MSEKISRRTFVQRTAITIGAAAIAPQALAQAIEPQHKFHEFLTLKGIDSKTAPADLTASFKDSNQSILHIAGQGIERSFDIRLKGGQTKETVNANIRNFIVKQLGAKPITPNGAIA